MVVRFLNPAIRILRKGRNPEEFILDRSRKDINLLLSFIEEQYKDYRLFINAGHVEVPGFGFWPEEIQDYYPDKPVILSFKYPKLLLSCRPRTLVNIEPRIFTDNLGDKKKTWEITSLYK